MKVTLPIGRVGVDAEGVAFFQNELPLARVMGNAR